VTIVVPPAGATMKVAEPSPVVRLPAPGDPAEVLGRPATTIATEAATTAFVLMHQYTARGLPVPAARYQSTSCDSMTP
jgi:hypothetical protein